MGIIETTELVKTCVGMSVAEIEEKMTEAYGGKHWVCELRSGDENPGRFYGVFYCLDSEGGFFYRLFFKQKVNEVEQKFCYDWEEVAKNLTIDYMVLIVEDLKSPW